MDALTLENNSHAHIRQQNAYAANKFKLSLQDLFTEYFISASVLLSDYVTLVDQSEHFRVIAWLLYDILLFLYLYVA